MLRRRDAARVLDMKPEVLLPAAECPHCGTSHDAASGLTTHYPEAGDVSVCLDCAGVSVYTADLQREKWPENEPHPPEVLEAVGAVRGLRS